MKKSILSGLIVLTLVVLLVLSVTACDKTPSVVSTSDTTEAPAPVTTPGTLELLPVEPDTVEEGISWPDGQILPWFAEPAATLESVMREQFESDELLSVVALQGIVNKTKPRLLVLSETEEEGTTTWSGALGRVVRVVSDHRLMETMKKYAAEADGVVLYSTARSEHYRNLALTAASTKNALPMTQEVYEKWQAAGITLPILEDLRDMTLTSEVDIYNHLYNTYWEASNHRLLISLSPTNTYNLHDLATGVGSATVYLDCTNREQKAVFEKFLADMEPGNASVMGWYTTERSGISTVASHGLSTIPADFFNNASVYAGMPHTIKTAGIPDKPALEDKVYVMIVVSDGDNIQYNQHAMRLKWNDSGRGKVPLNWTVSPALVDIAPNILNFYYNTATPNDCLICGPSGMGYALLVNSLAENGAPTGDYMKDPALFTSYVKMTDRYLWRSGLRVVTIWDYATSQQMELYTKNTEHLWGLTVHYWGDSRQNLTQVVNNTLIQQFVLSYGGNLDEAYNRLGTSILSCKAGEPSFVAIQLSVWGEDFSASNVASMAERLKDKFPQVEFVRADHFYALYNEANGLPFDLSISPALEVTVSDGQSRAKSLTDGKPTSLWKANDAGSAEITLALGDTYDLTELRLYHAASAQQSPSLNTAAYRVEVSSDGETFTTLREVTGNTEAYNRLELSAEGVTHLRLVITDPGADGVARLAEIELYGRCAE